MRMRPTKVSGPELAARFDGQLYHFRGRHSCYASTVTHGDFRFNRWTSWHRAMFYSREFVADTEYSNKTQDEIAQRILLERAKALPPVVPRLAGLNAHLHAINARTLDPHKFDAAVTSWMLLIELDCEAPEGYQAFDAWQCNDVDRALTLKTYAPDFADRVVL